MNRIIDSYSYFNPEADSLKIVQKLLFNLYDVASPEGVLRVLGFVHLYTASGVHLYILLDWIEKMAISVRNARIKRILPLAVLIVFYWLWELQDFRFGFLRPLLTFLIRWTGRTYGWSWHKSIPLALTAVVDFAVSDLSMGRLHYYGAVGGGLWFTEIYKIQPQSKLYHASLAWGSWIFLAGMELCIDRRVSLMTPLWSLISLPIICAIFYPLLVGSLAFAQWGWKEPLRIVTLALNEVVRELCIFAERLGLTFWVIEWNTVLVSGAISLILVFAFKFKRNTYARGVTLIGLFFCGVLFMHYPKKPGVEVAQLDVGQGDALLVKKENKAAMVDVGSFRAKKDEDWLLLFSKFGVHELNSVLLTHLDEDHAGAMKRLSRLIPIRCLEVNEVLITDSIIEKFSRFRYPKILKNCFTLGSVTWVGKSKLARNGMMAGVIIPINENTAYMGAGDASEKLEKEFLEKTKTEWSRYPNRIWKVSHHGSKNSTNLELLKKIDPMEAWVSLGKRNSYGHPHWQTLLDLQQAGILVRRTDQSGNLLSVNKTNDSWRSRFETIFRKVLKISSG